MIIKIDEYNNIKAIDFCCEFMSNATLITKSIKFVKNCGYLNIESSLDTKYTIRHEYCLECGAKITREES